MKGLQPSPMVGAAAMALSSVLVVSNALRLRRFEPPSIIATEETRMSVTFDVKEMTCGNCVKHVTKAVQEAQPGAEVMADLATGKVTVSPTPPDPQAIARAITEAGYPAQLAE